MTLGESVFSCSGLSKNFGPVQALKNLDFELKRGEVRALLGKNGAGKSTLVNLISGSLQPDSGVMALNGRTVEWSGPRAAQSGGMAVVHQEFSLVPGLTVSENITLGRWPKKGGFIDRSREKELARSALGRLGVDIPIGVAVGTLPLAEQQIVEIAKALLEDPQVLILDEPTSALNSREVEALIGLVRRLAASGISIIYVSHRMKEIPLVADTLTILRDGEEIVTEDVASMSSDLVAEHISGEKTVQTETEKNDRTSAPVILEVRNLKVPERLNGISFELHQGEVLGIAGLLGSGRTEILQSIFGLRDDATGSIFVEGKQHTRRNPRKMLNLRVAYISEDRKGSGIVPRMSVGENILFTARGRVLPKFWINRSRERELVNTAFESLSIRASSPGQPIGNLSGGNQQKAVIARALAADMKILLLDEPTRGVDVQAKAQLYGLVRDLASRGVSSIFVSSELEEIAEVCDRVLILRDGLVQEELLRDQGTPERILALAMKQEVTND
jgi:ABC-type sugar transport system ATPase subunit